MSSKVAILDYERNEVVIISIENDDLIQKKFNGNVYDFITGDVDDGGLGYTDRNISWLSADSLTVKMIIQ